MGTRIKRFAAVAALAMGLGVTSTGTADAAGTWHYLKKDWNAPMIVKTPGQSCSSAEYAKLAQTAWHTILRCMPLRTSPVTYHYTYVKVNPANGYVCTSDGYFRGKYGLLLSISAQKRNVTLCSGPLSYRLSGAVWLD